MIEYVKSKGIDITSEFTYKESEILPNKPIFGLPRDHFKSSPMDTVGLIPMSWWCYRITEKGNEFLYFADVTNGKISLKTEADTAYIVLLKCSPIFAEV